jgi:hypothetical protein
LARGEFGIYAAIIALTGVASACSQEFGGTNYLNPKVDFGKAGHKDRIHDYFLHVSSVLLLPPLWKMGCEDNLCQAGEAAILMIKLLVSAGEIC